MIMQDPYTFFQENSWIFNHDLETLLLVDHTEISCASFQEKSWIFNAWS